MNPPIATYRVQLHKDFNFRALTAVIDHLYALGISTIYASPVTTASPGSLHGYDVTDPLQLNPEIGTMEELDELGAGLQQRGMSWLQDIVPNHMSFSSPNEWLMDVLERGEHSFLSAFFDILYRHPVYPGRIMAPFLDEPLEACVAAGKVRLTADAEGVYVLTPGDRYPLSLTGYYLLFIELPARDTALFVPPALAQLGLVCMQPHSSVSWRTKKEAALGEVWATPVQRKQLDSLIELVNSRQHWLFEILERQYYVLCPWQQVNRVINYRRFFTVSSLIGLKMEAETLFDIYHGWLYGLYEKGLVQGLRIDHIDGLYAPGEYVNRLRRLFGPNCYLIAEKILADKEQLPATWSLQGTSGYEFLAWLRQLYCRESGMQQLTALYRELAPGFTDYSDLVRRNKRLILERYMAGELENLVQLFLQSRLAAHQPQARWQQALGAFMVHLPVYRLYPVAMPLGENDRNLITKTLAAARNEWPGLSEELNYLQALFTATSLADDQRQAVLLFLQRMMQFTGPLMAKGVEDTTFYQYHRLLSACEVGDTPVVSHLPVPAFHRLMDERQRVTPHALNGSATHDTKRGEDGRMRLNVLSSMAGEWEKAVRRWMSLNEPLRIAVGDRLAPSPNEMYFIYQSVVAGFPADLQCTDQFIERLQACMVKALREAKVNSHWEEPAADYEDACKSFIAQLLDRRHGFLDQFVVLADHLIPVAEALSLGQVLIKITAPGLPDFYQGCESWDLSYVDPDNRRPVNYDVAKHHLQAVKALEQEGADAMLAYARQHRVDGVPKLYVIWKGLQFRQQQAALFAEGRYQPLETDNAGVPVLAYARVLYQVWAVVVVPLEYPMKGSDHDLVIVLPQGAPLVWHNLLTGEQLQARPGGKLAVGASLRRLPAGLWHGEPA